MNKQLSSFVSSILRQILDFQRDGYTDFVLKNGREMNPNPADPNSPLEECIVLDMTLPDKGEAKTVNYFFNG